MQINGMNVYMGAYAERHQSNYQIGQQKLVISEEKSAEIAKGIKEAYTNLHLQDRGVHTTISQEDMDFLCSEEGFQKMKQDAQNLYVVNANQQKAIAAGRDSVDSFWNNTGNQWLTFSESLNNSGFFDDMSDEQVKSFEDSLAYITSGMDRLSRSQYETGMDFSSFNEEFKYFMTSAEATTELESSTAALRYMSDKMIPDEQREDFNNLIDMYHKHNSEIISEYVNPMESFNRVVAGINATREKNPDALEPVAQKPVAEYKYTVMLGNVQKSENDRKAFGDEMKDIFSQLSSGKTDDVWEKVQKKLAEYATDESDDEGLNAHVASQADYLFKHMRDVWQMVLNMQK